MKNTSWVLITLFVVGCQSAQYIPPTIEPALVIPTPTIKTFVFEDAHVPEVIQCTPVTRSINTEGQEDLYSDVPIWFYKSIAPNFVLDCNSAQSCQFKLANLVMANHEGGKQYFMDKDFVPYDLVNLFELNIVPTVGEKHEISLRAVGLLENWVDELTKNNSYQVIIRSAYRSFEDQRLIFPSNPNGAAPPGYSQHQTGFAVDVWQQDENHEITEPLFNVEIIQIAQKFGIVHPFKWDRPHYFVLDAVYPGATQLMLDAEINPHNMENINAFILGYAEILENYLLDDPAYCQQD